MRLGISRRGKEKRVHQSEYGRILADAEGEQGYRGNRKSGRLKQLAERKFKILNHALWLRVIVTIAIAMKPGAFASPRSATLISLSIIAGYCRFYIR